MNHIKLPFSADTYRQRRQQLMSLVGSGKILLLGNKESSINFEDNWYHFRQDSTFLYYTGLALPDLNLIIDADKGQTIVFGDDATIDMIIWTGDQPKLSGLAEQAGIQKVMGAPKLGDFVDQDMHYLPPYRSEHQVVLKALSGGGTLDPSLNLIKAVIQQRAIKSQEEIEELDKAASISALMHKSVIEAARPGMKEHELVAVASQLAWQHDTKWSFQPILTINGQILHNHYYGNTLKEGDLVLFDGGVEVASGYAGDLTRTFPVSAAFSPLQKDLYNIVRKAYQEARDMAKPGVRFKDVHLRAGLELCKGLKELGWMKGDMAAAVAAGAHTMFFQCGLGHMMGLDVHDMENLGERYVGYDESIQKSKEFGLKSLRLGRALEEGFVITIEPGIYIIPDLIDLFWSQGKFKDFINYEVLNAHRDFGGIRIEDDFVITATGARQIGEPLTTKAEEIENLRKG